MKYCEYVQGPNNKMISIDDDRTLLLLMATAGPQIAEHILVNTSQQVSQHGQ